MHDTVYDYIIVGAGIAGLYTAYKLTRNRKQLKILILEKEKQIGGRAGTDMFYGTKIMSGAGIGRAKKDKTLLRLLKELKIPVRFYTTKINSIGFKRINILKTMNQLKIKYKRSPLSDRRNMTFKKFAIKHLGIRKYNKFKLSSGYTDYENDDVCNVLYNYGMEDNVGGWKAFSVDWRNLIDQLAKRIGKTKIKTNQEVNRVSKKSGESFILKTETNEFKTNKVVIASTVNTVRKLIKNTVYNQIESQPFLRIYGKFNKISTQIINEKLHTFTFVKGPLQKLIPINRDKGVYMICYNDNDHTLQLQSKLKNNKRNRNYFCRLVEKALVIDHNQLLMIGMKVYNWKEGTHYYKPFGKTGLKELIFKAQHPIENILVVGEMVSENQGWVNSALESVDKII